MAQNPGWAQCLPLALISWSRLGPDVSANLDICPGMGEGRAIQAGSHPLGLPKESWVPILDPAALEPLLTKAYPELDAPLTLAPWYVPSRRSQKPSYCRA